MFSSNNWDSLYTWLMENHHDLTKNEKEQWIEHLSDQNEKMLDLWSERLELLDEVKEKLLSNAPLSFKKEDEDLKGIQYFHLGLYDKAIELLHAEVERAKSPSRVYLYLGFSYLYLNKEAETKEQFLNVIQRSKDSLEKHFAFLGLGLYSGRNNEIEEAISYLEKAEELLFNSDVVYNLGICYLLLGMPTQAIPYFEKVIRSGDGDGESYYWLGKCYIDAGNNAQGMETWYQAIQQFDSRELLHSLAIEFEEKELFSCALYCYERLKDLGEDTPHVLHGLAWNYGLLDERKKSLGFFKQSFEKNCKDTNAWISYLWLLNKWEEEILLQEAILKVKQFDLSHPLLTKIVGEAKQR